MSRAPIPIISPTLEAYLGLAHYAVNIHIDNLPERVLHTQRHHLPKWTPAHEALAQVLNVRRLQYEPVDLLRDRQPRPEILAVEFRLDSSHDGQRALVQGPVRQVRAVGRTQSSDPQRLSS